MGDAPLGPTDGAVGLRQVAQIAHVKDKAHTQHVAIAEALVHFKQRRGAGRVTQCAREVARLHHRLCLRKFESCENHNNAPTVNYVTTQSPNMGALR